MTAAMFWANIGLVLGAALVWGLVALWSFVAPARAVWPPARGTWPTAIWAWGVTALIYMGSYGLGLADWNPHGLPALLTWGLGGALTLAGNALHLKSMVDLGLAGTSGWDVGVSRQGSYAWLRHPQYTAQAIVFAGWAVLAANGPTALAAGIAIAALILVGRAEEHVLRQRHPAAYEAYATEVNGWLPRRPQPAST